MKNNAWLKFPVELLAREDITPLVKIVYVYMLQRYHFFVVERKQQYYETQEEISKNCNTGRKAANTAIRTLTNLGWISIEKQKQRGTVQNNIYTVHDVFGVYQEREKHGEPVISVPKKKLFNPDQECDNAF